MYRTRFYVVILTSSILCTSTALRSSELSPRGTWATADDNDWVILPDLLELPTEYLSHDNSSKPTPDLDRPELDRNVRHATPLAIPSHPKKHRNELRALLAGAPVIEGPRKRTQLASYNNQCSDASDADLSDDEETSSDSSHSTCTVPSRTAKRKRTIPAGTQRAAVLIPSVHYEPLSADMSTSRALGMLSSQEDIRVLWAPLRRKNIPELNQRCAQEANTIYARRDDIRANQFAFDNFRKLVDVYSSPGKAQEPNLASHLKQKIRRFLGMDSHEQGGAAEQTRTRQLRRQTLDNIFDDKNLLCAFWQGGAKAPSLRECHVMNELSAAYHNEPLSKDQRTALTNLLAARQNNTVYGPLKVTVRKLFALPTELPQHADFEAIVTSKKRLSQVLNAEEAQPPHQRLELIAQIVSLKNLDPEETLSSLLNQACYLEEFTITKMISEDEYQAKLQNLVYRLRCALAAREQDAQ